MIGSLGDIVFSVSREKIYTFSGLSHTVGAKYATHNRIGLAPLLEYTGQDVEKISMNIQLLAKYGINPLIEAERLNELCLNGTPLRFMLGKEQIGRFKWVITSISNKMDHIDNNGLIYKADLSITMQSYAER